MCSLDVRQTLNFVARRCRLACALAAVACISAILAAGHSWAQGVNRDESPTAAQAPLVSARHLAAMRSAADAYSRLAASGGWPTIPKGAQLRAGDADERVASLRRRLAAEAYLRSASGSSEFDAALEDALKAFQRRHGLRESGILNAETLQALNVPAAARAAQLARSAERVAELLSHTKDGPYVLVNVPGFELQVVSQGRVALYSPVIVGKPTTQSPSVRASIRAVDLMPYWHVPPGVAERAIIPAIRKDPNYLAKERIRVFSAWGGAEVDPATVNWFAPQASRYVFRQDPGPHNALGLIRIDMPNQYTVYMHDTPMKRLFASRSRPFSAGCIRVQSIYALAGLLLGEDEHTVQRRLEPLLASGGKTTLKVPTPIPVHFTYLTAWTDAAGRAEFRHDLYDKDGIAMLIADAAPPPPAARTDPWHTRIFDLSP